MCDNAEAQPLRMLRVEEDFEKYFTRLSPTSFEWTKLPSDDFLTSMNQNDSSDSSDEFLTFSSQNDSSSDSSDESLTSTSQNDSSSDSSDPDPIGTNILQDSITFRSEDSFWPQQPSISWDHNSSHPPHHRQQRLELLQEDQKHQEQEQDQDQQQQHHDQQATTAVPLEMRQNRRRTAPGHLNRPACPPSLLRQCDRRVNFVDSLVDSSTQIVEVIWPLSSASCQPEFGSKGKGTLPLRTFIQETLRRSRTSYSTLQVALYYLILIKPHIPRSSCFQDQQLQSCQTSRGLRCGRRMFLAALILASKYLQDRNYSARAWSKISGLSMREINQNEVDFLNSVKWKLHITDEVFRRWTDIVLKYTPLPSPPSPDPQVITKRPDYTWKRIILDLDPDLSNVESLIPSAAQRPSSDLCTSSPRSILNISEQQQQVADASMPAHAERASPPQPMAAPPEPLPPIASLTKSGRFAPTLGYPSPCLTPERNGFGPPAASADAHMLGKGNAMCMAVAQANNVDAAQKLDRMHISAICSPQRHVPPRRSSLADTISTASSPESMISDSSLISRASSISSASSSSSALSRRSMMFSRRRLAPPRIPFSKDLNDELAPRSIIWTGLEDYQGPYSYSPELCGPVECQELELNRVLASRHPDLDHAARDPASDAAQGLIELHDYPRFAGKTTPLPAKIGIKRGRPLSMDSFRQDDVCEYGPLTPALVVTPQGAHISKISVLVGVQAKSVGPRKRLRSYKDASDYQAKSPSRMRNGSLMFQRILKPLEEEDSGEYGYRLYEMR